MKNVVVLLIVLGMCSFTMAAEIAFTGNVGGGLYSGDWEDPGAWFIHPDPAGRIPLATDNAGIDRGWDGALCTVNDPGAVCNNLTVAYWYPNNTLTVNPGASIDVRGNLSIGGRIGSSGVVINNGDIFGDNATATGSVFQTIVGAEGTGYYEQNAGSLITDYLNAPFWWATAAQDAVGHIQLNGGEITVWAFALHTNDGVKHGTMDITDGTLHLTRDDSALITQYINDGWMTGYGQTGMDYFNIDTTTTPGHVYVTAIPEPLTLSLLGLGGLALIRRRRA